MFEEFFFFFELDKDLSNLLINVVQLSLESRTESARLRQQIKKSIQDCYTRQKDTLKNEILLFYSLASGWST